MIKKVLEITLTGDEDKVSQIIDVFIQRTPCNDVQTYSPPRDDNRYSAVVKFTWREL